MVLEKYKYIVIGVKIVIMFINIKGEIQNEYRSF